MRDALWSNRAIPHAGLQVPGTVQAQHYVGVVADISEALQYENNLNECAKTAFPYAQFLFTEAESNCGEVINVIWGVYCTT